MPERNIRALQLRRQREEKDDCRGAGSRQPVLRRSGDDRVCRGHLPLNVLQISLLAEHEITRLVTLVSGIADRMAVKTEADADLEEVTLDVAPEAVLDEVEATERTNG